MKTESSNPRDEKLTTKVAAAAAAFVYPATPDVRGAVRRRLTSTTHPRANRRLRLAWVALFLALLCAGTLAVPGIRAHIADFFQIKDCDNHLTQALYSLPVIISPSKKNLIDYILNSRLKRSKNKRNK